MRCRQLTGATRMTSTQTQAAARSFSCKMQRHILFFPPPNQGTILCSLTFMKARPKWEKIHKNNPSFPHAASRWSCLVCINMCIPRIWWWCIITTRIPAQMALKKKAAVGRYVAKYCSNWKGTSSCCQRRTKKHCYSHKERSTAWCFYKCWNSDICVCTVLSSGSVATQHTHILDAPAKLVKDPETVPFKRIIPPSTGAKKKKSLPSIIWNVNSNQGLLGWGGVNAGTALNTHHSIQIHKQQLLANKCLSLRVKRLEKIKKKTLWKHNTPENRLAQSARAHARTHTRARVEQKHLYMRFMQN